MAELFERIEGLADDEVFLQRLSDDCGLSMTEGRHAYEAAVALVERRLLAVSAERVETKSLVRSVRSVQRSDNADPVNFATGGDADDLAVQVFGSGTDEAMSALMSSAEISEERARSVLETTTAVALSSIGQSVGDEVTFESVSACLAAENAGVVVPDGDGVPSPESSAGRAAAAVGSDEGVAHPAMAGAAKPPASLSASSPGSDGAGRSKAWLAAVPVIALVAGGAFLVLNSGGDDTLAFSDESTSTSARTDDTTTDVTTADSTTDDITTDDVTTDDSTTDEPADDEAAADDGQAAPAASEAEATPAPGSPPIPIGAPDNYAVMSQGTIYLRGFLSSEEQEAQILAAIEQFVGPGGAVSEYVIDPVRAAEGDANDEGTPVYIEDSVLFETGSAEVAPDFAPLLGIGLRLLEIQPNVTIEVTGHTDSNGSDTANLALSQARVDTVKEFFVAQGIDPSRVVAIGKGESEPRADNGTPEGRQANRRVEFLVKGFSYGP